VLIFTYLRPASTWRGHSAATACIVEQLGLAIIPLCLGISSGFTSGTTSGTSGSILQAELLSMTTEPESAATGAHFLEVDPPAEKSAISIFLKESSETASTVISSPLKTAFVPADLGDASGRSLETG